MSRRDRPSQGGTRYGVPAREPARPTGARPTGSPNPTAGGSPNPARPAGSPNPTPADPPHAFVANDDRPTLRERIATASVPAAALLPVRFFFGATFVYAGIDKLIDPSFFDAASATSIQAQLAAFARVSPLAPLVRVGEPFAVPIGLLIALAEIAIGLGALSGLAYRVAAAGGAAISLLFWLTASWATHPYYYGPDLPYAAGWMVLAIAGHGGLLVPRWVLAVGRAPGRRPVRGSARAPGRAGASLSRTRQDRSPLAVESPERRTLLQLGVLAIAAVAVGAVASPLRLLRPASSGAGGAGATGGTPGGAGPSPSPGATLAPGSSPTPAATQAPGGTPAAQLAIAKVADVDRAGGLAFTVPFDAPAPLPAGDPGVVVKLADGSYVAYDAVCTHEGCTVDWDGADGVLLCPCHGAAFDPAQRARVLQGPTRQPLAALPIKVDTATGQIVLTA